MELPKDLAEKRDRSAKDFARLICGGEQTHQNAEEFLKLENDYREGYNTCYAEMRKTSSGDDYFDGWDDCHGILGEYLKDSQRREKKLETTLIDLIFVCDWSLEEPKKANRLLQELGLDYIKGSGL